MALTGHNGRDHGVVQTDDPNNKGEKKTVCAKFPTMTCDIHEQMGGRLNGFTKLEYQYVPFTAIVDPGSKALIDSWTGDWSMSQMQKKMALVEKAMPGPRVSQDAWNKYSKALDLIKEEKQKEALPILESLAKGKNPEKFQADLTERIQKLKDAAAAK